MECHQSIIPRSDTPHPPSPHSSQVPIHPKHIVLPPQSRPVRRGRRFHAIAASPIRSRTPSPYQPGTTPPNHQTRTCIRDCDMVTGPQPIPVPALTPPEKSRRHPQRQCKSWVSRRRRHQAATPLDPRDVHRVRDQLPRHRASRHGGKDGRRPTGRAENHLEPSPRRDDERRCLVVERCTTVSAPSSPPSRPCHPPKLYASGHTRLASWLYKLGLHTLGLSYFPVQQSAGWLYLAHAE